MPVDIRSFREGNLKYIRTSIRKRGGDEKVVDAIVESDKLWRDGLRELGLLQAEVNRLSKDIGKLKKAKQEAKHLIKKVPTLKASIKKLDLQVAKQKNITDSFLSQVGNFLHESVPEGREDKEVLSWGNMDIKEAKGMRSHDELLEMIDGYDPVRGNEVGGSRGYFLKGYGMLLNHALQTYALQFLVKRDFIPVQPPVMIRPTIMKKVAQLASFEEDLYKVSGGKQDMFLAATAEQPLCGLHSNEILEEASLPKLYCGLSTCFRKELTSHGVDATGVFRVHNFEKVEQFAVTSPHESWKMHEKLLENSMEFYQSLKIPYRVVNVAAKSLSMAAAKKYDLEGWFPSQKECRELVSCSNCTDYQSRALKIRFGHPRLGITHTSKKSQMVHMLNATLCASQRTLCCLLENHQTPAGIRVPEPLIIYVGTAFIPFTKKGKDTRKAKNDKATKQKKASQSSKKKTKNTKNSKDKKG
mmetsp:Transcript_8976/g.13428  ORF Transcript_8976/g.13428 Transcript_8976/m.13428 type:complete len:471 (-) Transcript_8976:71-1483(-)|eukprot:CAMPEP_0167763710 /NCGR_PEP_ID=MMETSP0110_2-20121227/13555_1 /TAXON_ID=629695 /ORGANISM="Gymnochlora sp., Strain CCMP2014" /LENGTH=470 /DNA_ID=CAMNT_0007650887 /DNA_START=39 /DNA_END=1451 /DNA_ORIENTATION=-